MKFIVEDEQASRDAVDSGEEVIRTTRCGHVGRRSAGVERLRAGAGQRPTRRSTSCRFRRLDDLTERDLSKLPYMVRTGWSSRAEPPRRAVGLRTRLQEDRRIGATMPSATRSSAASSAHPRPAAGKDHPEHRPPPGAKDFGTVYPDYQGRSRTQPPPSMVGPMALEFPKQLALGKRSRSSAADELRRIAPPSMGDEAIGHGRAAIQRRAGKSKNEAFVKKYRAKTARSPRLFGGPTIRRRR